MADNFNSLPDDVETLQNQLLEKERFIQDLILENLALKNSVLNETLEEQNVELEDDSEPITLKKFDDEDNEDDEENIPNLGENLDQTDFFNILKMFMRQEATGFQSPEGEEQESVEEPLADETVD